MFTLETFWQLTDSVAAVNSTSEGKNVNIAHKLGKRNTDLDKHYLIFLMFIQICIHFGVNCPFKSTLFILYVYITFSNIVLHYYYYDYLLCNIIVYNKLIWTKCNKILIKQNFK